MNADGLPEERIARYARRHEDAGAPAVLAEFGLDVADVEQVEALLAEARAEDAPDTEADDEIADDSEPDPGPPDPAAVAAAVAGPGPDGGTPPPDTPPADPAPPFDPDREATGYVPLDEADDPPPDPEAIAHADHDEHDDLPRLPVGEEAPPDWVVERDWWVAWQLDEKDRKRPRAPWVTGQCYPASWRGTLPDEERPETAYQHARQWVDHDPEALGRTHPCPEDGPPDLSLGVILPPERPDDPGETLMLLDFDKVRDPETGEVTREVWRLIRWLDAYVEVSQSGTGLHVFVRAHLPDRESGETRGNFFAGLQESLAVHDEESQIELYDHGRHVAMTHRHAQGTPFAVPEAQAKVDELVEVYKEWEQSGGGELPERETDPDRLLQREAEDRFGSPDEDDAGGRSPYFDIDVRRVANTGPFASHAVDVGDELQGPHPKHGGTSSADAESTNTAVTRGRWYCFAHDSGAGRSNWWPSLKDWSSVATSRRRAGAASTTSRRTC